MSPPRSLPERTHALLVGIESYEAGRSWELDGPARDLLDIHAWLTGHGVPANQIKTLASPLPHNATRLAEQNVAYEPATSYTVRRGLDALQKADGDLLVIFWAGHAAYNQRQHRLFLSDSTTANKRNIEWERLRNSLSSTYFGRFARQIVIVDACADIRKDWAFTAPGEPIPEGDPVAREQFVLFATREGQTAANLDTERRGLFTRELVRLFGSDAHRDAWPPDMPEIARAVRHALEDQTGGGQVPRFESRDWDGNIDTFAPEPAVVGAGYGEVTEPERVALVIGISQYQQGIPPGRELQPWQFTNLEFAAADASAMHAFLSERQDYEVTDLLLDGQATLSGILRALDGLRRRCQHGRKTAVIYFSGHGACDTEGRSYLVPHDARRDDLFATALWNKTIASVLDEFEERRLVLLLDACHAGAIGVGGSKAAQLEGFDANALAEGAAGNRYILSSCQPQQQSYEGDGHGIFTQHLLSLLRGDDLRAVPDEEIELFDLYSALRPKVRETAMARHKAAQEPFANFTTRTGVVLAINETVRRERIERPHRYMSALLDCLARRRYEQQRRFEVRLRNHVEKGERQPTLQKFYEFFAEGLRTTDPADPVAVDRDCADLIDYYERAIAIDLPPQRQGNRRPGAGPDRAPVAAPSSHPAVDALAAAAPSLDAPSSATAQTLLFGTQPPGLGAATAAEPTRARSDTSHPDVEDRRLFADADVTYILRDMLSDPRLYREAGQLRTLLMQDGGVSAREVTSWLAVTAPRARPDNWDAMCDAIAERFIERFQTARTVVRTNTLSLRVGQGG